MSSSSITFDDPRLFNDPRLAKLDGFAVEIDEARERADIILDRPPLNVVSMPQRDQLRMVFEHLDQHCRDSGLAPFKRPRRYVFVETIPKSPVGKLLRRLLVAGEYELERSAPPRSQGTAA